MKQITLTQGKVAIVDNEDFESLSKFKWHYRYMRSTHKQKGYAARTVISESGKRVRVFMHHQILDASPVDHIDGDGLNNCRANLRLCSQADNSRNKTIIRRNKSSEFRGVCWNKRRQKWEASIGFNYRTIYLGLYQTEAQAALAYNEAAKRYFGKFARLNEVTL